MNKKQIVASLNNIANELDNSGLYAEASTVTKVMSRLASDMDIVQERDLSGLVGNIMDPEVNRGDLFGKYMDNNKNKVIDALAEAIQDMEDNDMISDAEIDKVRQIMNELKSILS